MGVLEKESHPEHPDRRACAQPGPSSQTGLRAGHTSSGNGAALSAGPRPGGGCTLRRPARERGGGSGPGDGNPDAFSLRSHGVPSPGWQSCGLTPSHTHTPRPHGLAHVCTHPPAHSRARVDLWPPKGGVGAGPWPLDLQPAEPRAGQWSRAEPGEAPGWSARRPAPLPDAGAGPGEERLVKTPGLGRGQRQPQTRRSGRGSPSPSSRPSSTPPLSTPCPHPCPGLPASFQTFRGSCPVPSRTLLSAGATRGRPAARSPTGRPGRSHTGQDAQARTLPLSRGLALRAGPGAGGPASPARPSLPPLAGAVGEAWGTPGAGPRVPAGAVGVALQDLKQVDGGGSLS